MSSVSGMIVGPVPEPQQPPSLGPQHPPPPVAAVGVEALPEQQPPPTPLEVPPPEQHPPTPVCTPTPTLPPGALPPPPLQHSLSFSTHANVSHTGPVAAVGPAVPAAAAPLERGPWLLGCPAIRHCILFVINFRSFSSVFMQTRTQHFELSHLVQVQFSALISFMSVCVAAKSN